MGLPCCPGTSCWWCAGGRRANSTGSRALAAVGRALGATAGMALGLCDGVRIVRGADHIGGHDGAALPAVCDSGDRRWCLIALGIWLLSGRELTALTPRPLGPRWAPTVRQGSAVIGMYGYGVSYAIASLSCTVAPFLAVTAAGFAGAVRSSGA